jgi:hypothetical protein
LLLWYCDEYLQYLYVTFCIFYSGSFRNDGQNRPGGGNRGKNLFKSNLQSKMAF